jgi:hypothetical protein
MIILPPSDPNFTQKNTLLALKYHVYYIFIFIFILYIIYLYLYLYLYYIFILLADLITELINGIKDDDIYKYMNAFPLAE